MIPRATAAPVIRALLHDKLQYLDSDSRGYQWLRTIESQAGMCLEGFSESYKAAEAIYYSLEMMRGEVERDEGLVSVGEAIKAGTAVMQILTVCL